LTQSDRLETESISQATIELQTVPSFLEIDGNLDKTNIMECPNCFLAEDQLKRAEDKLKREEDKLKKSDAKLS